MKVVHIEGGLGNQMACYAVYVAVKRTHPQEDIYVDTFFYDIKEAHGTISGWNGYELDNVFGLKLCDIRNLFTEKQVEEQIDYLKNSKFWENDWGYADVFIKMMKKYDILLTNAYSEKLNGYSLRSRIRKKIKRIFTESTNSRFIYKLKRVAYPAYKKIVSDKGRSLLEYRNGDWFYDITLDFMKSKYLTSEIGADVRKGLKFKEPEGEEYRDMLFKATTSNSVSIHVRRTDYLRFNGDCYLFGFFSMASNYIKKKTSFPIFYILSDDIKWCRENLSVLGLDDNDEVIFVDSNRGKDSFRDMQIMSCCKHNIVTKSSFGWWGSFLNTNPDKIVCMQMSEYLATVYL